MDLHIGTPGSRAVGQTAQQELSCRSLRQACQEFESVFIAYLMKSMRKTIPQTEFTGGESSLGFSKDVYLSMMDEEIASVVAKGPGIGLAAALYRQLSQGKNT